MLPQNSFCMKDINPAAMSEIYFTVLWRVFVIHQYESATDKQGSPSIKNNFGFFKNFSSLGCALQHVGS